MINTEWYFLIYKVPFYENLSLSHFWKALIFHHVMLLGKKKQNKTHNIVDVYITVDKTKGIPTPLDKWIKY